MLTEIHPAPNPEYLYNCSGCGGTAAEWLEYYSNPAAEVTQERIECSAIQHPDGTIYAVLAPGRHHHVIWMMASIGRAGLNNTCDQGFLTSRGRYLGREAALVVAVAARQIKDKTGSSKRLFSEDMW